MFFSGPCPVRTNAIYVEMLEAGKGEATCLLAPVSHLKGRRCPILSELCFTRDPVPTDGMLPGKGACSLFDWLRGADPKACPADGVATGDCVLTLTRRFWRARATVGNKHRASGPPPACYLTYDRKVLAGFTSPSHPLGLLSVHHHIRGTP